MQITPFEISETYKCNFDNMILYSKTKVLSTRWVENVRDKKNIEVLKRFNRDTSCKCEMKRRIYIRKNAVRLLKTIWMGWGVREEMLIKLIKALVCFIITYRSELWIIWKFEHRQINCISTLVLSWTASSFLGTKIQIRTLWRRWVRVIH